MDRRLPRYPVYVPTKGRSDVCLTAQLFVRDEIPFRLVVEPQERDAYSEKFGSERILVLPFRDPGSVIPARNWIKEHATAEGYGRHWQFDDNISGVWRHYRGERLYCRSGPALAACEDFVDRYENVAVAGLNYVMFGMYPQTPFVLNAHVYSASLILNSLPNKWRGRYNEDTDLCLQVLADGWCTILFNAFLVQKLPTMVMGGGNTDAIYHGDGRLKMANSLKRLWPRVVETKRRFQRPQHVVKDAWKKFDTPLRLKPDVNLEDLKPTDEYGMKLTAVKEVKSEDMKRLLRESQGE